MLTYLYYRTEALKKRFLNGKTVAVVCAAMCVMMFGYPDLITSYEFKVFGIDSRLFTLIGGSTVVAVTLPIFMVIGLNEALKYRVHPHTSEEACSCS